MTDLRLRRYDPRDADAAWTLHERALHDAGTDPADVPGTDDLRDVRGAYLDAGGEFLVGVDPGTTATDRSGPPPTHDGALVAMGGFKPAASAGTGGGTDGDVAELHRLRVAPSRQRRGHGRALLDELERRASDGGVGRLVATTAVRQRAAVAFYRAAGYEETGRRQSGAYELVRFEKRL